MKPQTGSQETWILVQILSSGKYDIISDHQFPNSQIQVLI